MTERSSGGTRTKSASGHPSVAAGQVSVWEWVVAAVSAIVVTGVIVTLLYQEFSSADSPPRVEVDAAEIVVLERGYLVEFVARNRGSRTAAEVAIEGRLETRSGVETAAVVLDFVPGNATRRGGLYFDADPRAGRLTLDAHGYREP